MLLRARQRATPYFMNKMSNKSDRKSNLRARERGSDGKELRKTRINLEVSQQIPDTNPHLKSRRARPSHLQYVQIPRMYTQICSLPTD